jgi:hypothetical protein
MQRTQVYLTDEQRERLDRRARDAGLPMAEILRRILDEGLGICDTRSDRLAAVRETAGALAGGETWVEFLERVRQAGGADARLRSLGL